MLREREEKHVANTDAKDLFKQIRERKDELTYAEAVHILNDLAFVIVPFDQNASEFRTLMSVIRKQLKTQHRDTMMAYELLEGLHRLRNDSLNTLLREKMRAKDVSRKSKDIAVQFLFFSQLYKTSRHETDAEIIEQLLNELNYLQLHDLEAEHISYLIEAFSVISQERATIPDQSEITKFVPNLLAHTHNEMYRYNMADCVTMMNGYFNLWNVGVLERKDLTTVHTFCQTYLSEYLHKSKRQISGSQFASLVNQVGQAKQHGIYQYDDRTIQRLEHMFVNDKQENFIFTITDLLKILENFEVLSTVDSQGKLIKTVTSLMKDSIKDSDESVLKLARIFNSKGMFEEDEELCHFL